MAYNKTRVQSGDSADNFVPEMWGNGVQNYIAKKIGDIYQESFKNHLRLKSLRLLRITRLKILQK